MYRGGQCIKWVDTLEYLGVNVICGKTLSFDLKFVKRYLSMLHVTTCILAHGKILDELVHLSHMSSTSLSLTVKHINEL